MSTIDSRTTSMQQHASIYIDLDSLFDTRLATIVKLQEERGRPIDMDVYYTRLSDEFHVAEIEGFDGLFKEAYSKRDDVTIVKSTVTRMPELLRSFIKATLLSIISSPLKYQPRIIINLHPYKLPEEIVNSIILGVRALTLSNADIEVIDVSLAELTPKYVRANFVEMIMYSYWEWLDTQTTLGNFKDTQCPGVRLIGPMLFKSEEAHRELTREGMSALQVFETIEGFTSPYVNLDLCPIGFYCADLSRLYAAKKT